MKEKQADKFTLYNVGDWATQGNVTEQAILNFFLQEFGGEGCIDRKKKLDSCYENVIGFTSKRKKASVIVKTDRGYRLYCKGAPDMLFPQTKSIIGVNGQVFPINEKTMVDPSLLTDKEKGVGAQETGM